MDKEEPTVYNLYNFRMSNILKEGRIGSFEVRKKVIPKGTIMEIYDWRNGRILKGEYDFYYPIVTLLEDNDVWMTDSQLEIESIQGAIITAKGDVLIGGLGIGLLPTFIKHKKGVKSITIVELHQEVIDLIFPYVKTDKMIVIRDGIIHYLSTTSNKYDFIHVDIWGTITAPLKDIDTIREKAKPCLKPNGIIWCWLQELYDRIKNKLPKEPILQTNSVAIHEPCLVCGKKLRNDYAGLCMDCADSMGISELFVKRVNDGDCSKP